MEYELNFNIIFDRLKSALNLKNDSQIAELIGMSTSAFSNLKKREAIPFEKVIVLAISNGISLDWLMGGYPDDIEIKTPEKNPLITRATSIISNLTPNQIEEISCIALEKQRINNLEQEVKRLTKHLKVNGAHQ